MKKYICKNCGYRVKNNVRYCPECGAEIQEYKNVGFKSNKILDKIKTIKKRYILCSFIVVIAVIVFVVIYNNKYNTFIRNYKNDNTDAIRSNYNNYSDKDIDKVYDYLSRQAVKIKDNYVNEKTTYEDTKSQLNKIGISCKTGKTLTDYINCVNEVEKLHNSREAFKIAEDFYSKNNYEKAIENYKKVIDSDGNYSESQAKIEALTPNVAQNFYDKAKNAYDKEDYSSALNCIDTAIKYSDKSDYEEMKQMCVDANEKAIADKAEADRQKKLLVSGKEISTTKFDIEYQGAAFDTRVLPEKTSGAYSYKECPNDSIFIDMRFYITNKSDYNANIDLVKNFKATYGSKNYNSCSQWYCEIGSTSLRNIYSSINIEPLKKVVYHLVVTLPYEAINTDESINITFKLDGQEQLLEFR